MRRLIKAILLLLILSQISLLSNSAILTEVDSTSLNLESMILKKNYTSHNPIYINSDDGFTVFEGLGTADNPYIIEGFNITTDEEFGIHISSTTKHFVVRNCYIDAVYASIFIEFVAPGTASIVENVCLNNELTNGKGIWISYSEETNIHGNICENNNYWGIELWGSYKSSIVENICSSNGQSGIVLVFSNHSIAAENICKDNEKNGIKVSLSGSCLLYDNRCSGNDFNGFFIDHSSGTSILNCTSKENGNTGILLRKTNGCLINYNFIINNKNYGFYISEGCDKNRIYYNNFIENDFFESSQAIDEGKENQWFHKFEEVGNYWSSWEGTGSYKLDGKSEAEDLYPQIELFEYEKNVEESTELLKFQIYCFWVIVLFLILRNTKINLVKSANFEN
ncbi:MAG: right-handed parallel beta-helix repeat-containing protein [Candidatus Heimdallarchaeota archaeon]|nr:right-handed parallel beta-helix repeat-containing protein [Candidatus Heimdallarchaeota archaeon]MCK4769965.1 right-handed parallel beta-helix repeat-containing protein [Candidatus Heimdallarchaeota archaeon]